MKKSILASLLLLLAASSFAADCPSGSLCLEGNWVIAQCLGGGSPPPAPACAGLPPEVLVVEPPAPGSLWADVYHNALLPAWEGGSAIRAILLDPGRDFIRSASFGVLAAHPELCAGGEEWAEAARAEAFRRLAALLGEAATVKRSADGRGGFVYSLLPRSTRCATCAVAFRLLKDEGWLAAVDLAAWYSPESALLADMGVEEWAASLSVDDIGRTVEP